MISNKNEFHRDLLRPLQIYYCRGRWCIRSVLHDEFTGLLGFRFSGNSCVQKLNKAQTKRVNITDVQCFRGIWYYLRVHQEEWCQLCLIMYPLFITLAHNLHQLPFSPPPPPMPPRECANTNRVCLHQRQNMLSPWFGWSCKTIWPHRPEKPPNKADKKMTTYPAAAELSANHRASGDTSVLRLRGGLHHCYWPLR